MSIQSCQPFRTLRISNLSVTLGRWTTVLILFGSCVSPYSGGTAAYTEALVIQGMITDEPGPYEVVVSKTIAIDGEPTSQTEVPAGISGARVTIADDEGNAEQLTEKSVGYYYTRSFQGVIGRSYSITVVTPDQAVYKSSVQKLLPVGEFDHSYQFQQVEDPFAGNQITSKNGFEVYINSKLDPGQEGRVWWRTIGTYHVETYPQNKMQYLTVGRPPTLLLSPNPPPCAFVLNAGCQCCDCWISVFDQKPLLSDPIFITNNEIKNLKMVFIPATRRTMFDKYVLEIQQLSVSQDVYNFWKTVAAASSNSSNLFQTPPPRTGRTFVAQNGSAKPVLGYFAASAIKRRYLTFSRFDVPYKIYPIDDVAESCLVAYRNATNQKPVFW